MKIGSIGYATEQGIGYLMKSFYDAGVLTDVCVFHHSSRVNHMEWYPPGTMEIARRPFDWPEIRAWLNSLDTLLCFETPFSWECLDFCRKEGVRTVVCPMYECCPRHVPVEPDCWACPSLLDLDIFVARCRACKGLGYMDTTTEANKVYVTNEPCHRHLFVPIPVSQPWQQRTKALRFLHNGGHLGLRGHKGTLELMRAMEFVKSPLSLTIRSQDKEGLERLLEKVPSIRSDQRVTFAKGSLPRERLFEGHDVLVQPEKYNGLSLPLQEARAAGMLVMTTDRYPHNTWLPKEPLIPVKSYSRQCVSGAFMEYDEAEVDPKDVAATMDAWYGQDIESYSRQGKGWAEANSWAAIRGKWMEVLTP